MFAVFCVPFSVNTVIDDCNLLSLYLVTLNTLQALNKQNAEAV